MIGVPRRSKARNEIMIFPEEWEILESTEHVASYSPLELQEEVQPVVLHNELQETSQSVVQSGQPKTEKGKARANTMEFVHIQQKEWQQAIQPFTQHKRLSNDVVQMRADTMEFVHIEPPLYEPIKFTTEDISSPALRIRRGRRKALCGQEEIDVLKFLEKSQKIQRNLVDFQKRQEIWCYTIILHNYCSEIFLRIKV